MVRPGILNVVKPAGMTSRDVVNRLQRRLPRRTKIGHAGTLDPLATGVLVVCVGQATRLIEYVQRMPKRYVGTFLLGRTSPTEDTDGQVTELENPPVPTEEQIRVAAADWTGEIQQRPPAYSALKVNGRRAYDLARAGKEVTLEPRPVTIYRLDLVRYAYPELVLDVECSSGTYIRSLGRDLAESLGTGAVMSALQRIAIGPFTLERAVELDRLTDEAARLEDFFLSPREAVSCLPTVTVSPQEVVEFSHGRSIARGADLESAEEYAAIGEEGELIAILVDRGKDRLGPSRFFGGG